jgi:hypothetical protein
MTAVSADELIGTWTLKSFVREISGTGERFDAMGAHPHGYLNYSRDGHMSVITVAAERIRPREAVPSDSERAQLYNSMVAYAGTYTVEGNKVVHHVDISWNDAWTGTDQVRFFTLDGDTLMIKSAPTKSPSNGRESVCTVVWKKVK